MNALFVLTLQEHLRNRRNLLFMVILWLLGVWTGSMNEGAFALSLSVGTGFLLNTVVAGMSSAQTLLRDRRQGVSFLFSKPLGRLQWLAGRFMGLAVWHVALWVLFGAGAGLGLTLREDPFSGSGYDNHPPSTADGTGYIQPHESRTWRFERTYEQAQLRFCLHSIRNRPLHDGQWAAQTLNDTSPFILSNGKIVCNRAETLPLPDSTVQISFLNLGDDPLLSDDPPVIRTLRYTFFENGLRAWLLLCGLIGFSVPTGILTGAFFSPGTAFFVTFGYWLTAGLASVERLPYLPPVIPLLSEFSPLEQLENGGMITLPFILGLWGLNLLRAFPLFLFWTWRILKRENLSL